MDETISPEAGGGLHGLTVINYVEMNEQRDERESTCTSSNLAEALADPVPADDASVLTYTPKEVPPEQMPVPPESWTKNAYAAAAETLTSMSTKTSVLIDTLSSTAKTTVTSTAKSLQESIMSSTTANSIHNYLGCVVDDIIEERQTKEDEIAEGNTVLKINETASIKTDYGTDADTAKDVTADTVTSTTPEQGMISALTSSLWTKMESIPAWSSSVWTKAESIPAWGSSLWTKVESLTSDLRTNVESLIIRYKQPENNLLEDIKVRVSSLPALLSTACAQIDKKVENVIGIDKNEVIMPTVDRSTSYDVTLKSENDTSLYSV